jgi:transcription termination factor Rho
MPGDFDDLFGDGPDLPVRLGVLEVVPEGWGFLHQRNPAFGRDIYVPQARIGEAGLKTGDVIVGLVRPPKETEKHSVLMHIRTVNGQVGASP